MAINWNNVAAPNLGESNSLFAQAIQSLKDAGAGLKDTAKDYQTVVRNKSHAILQDYINSAKTPEELQSEAFNIGFKNLQATLANEYDAVKVNEYRDTRGDVLTKRAGDAVALKRNEFGFAQEQLKAPTELDLLKTSLINAQTDADFKAKNNPLVLRSNTVTADNAEKTQAATIENANLAPTVTRHGMKIADGELAVKRQNASTSALEALARKAEADAKAGGGSAKDINATLDKGLANFRAIDEKLKADSAGKSPFKTVKEVDDAFIEGQSVSSTISSSMSEMKKILQANKAFVKLPDAKQAAIYATAISKIEGNNLNGSHDWYVTDGNRKDYANWANDAINEHTGYIQVAKDQQDIAKLDLINSLERNNNLTLQQATNLANHYLSVPATSAEVANADAKPNAMTPLEMTNKAKIAGLQEKLKVKGLDLLTKASLQNQLRELGVKP